MFGTKGRKFSLFHLLCPITTDKSNYVNYDDGLSTCPTHFV